MSKHKPLFYTAIVYIFLKGIKDIPLQNRYEKRNV